MPYRQTPFVTNGYYHIYNRGIDKRNIFFTDQDKKRFLRTISYYQIRDPKPKFSTYQVMKTFPVDKSKRIVEIICYCLMPNHFHLLVKQTEDGGISEFVRKFIHSYTKYFNAKHKHEGPIFMGLFKAVPIESDEQLQHVSRYIHLNPRVSRIVQDLEKYPWSSYQAYVANKTQYIPLKKDAILSFFKSPVEYKKFMKDQIAYGETLELIKHELLDIDQPHEPENLIKQHLTNLVCQAKTLEL